MESSQRTPSVIAQLMGLDELPPQEPVQKPQRVLSKSYLQRVASIGVREKQYKHNPLRMNFEEKKEMGNNFPVVETLKIDEHLDLSDEKRKANLGPVVAKMTFRQKYINTKCSSPDEKLQTSEEFQQLSDVIDSKNDQLPKHILEGNLKSSCTSDSSVENCRKSVRKTGSGYRNSVQKGKNGIVTGSNGKLSLNFRKFVRSELVLNNPHTRIVVLKPKHGKNENYIRYCSSASSNESSQSGANYLTDFCTARSEKIRVEVKGRKNLETDVEPSRQQPLISSELVEEITGRSMQKINSLTRLPRLESKADEDTFAVKYKFLMPPSSSFPDWKNGYRSFSNSDAYVTREAMKQPLERWKMNKRSEEVGLASKGSTLGEMLAMPYHNLRPKSHRPGRPGKKDLDLSKFSTQQSKHDSFCNEWYLGLEDSINQARHKSMKHNNQEDHSELSRWKHKYEKSQSISCLNSKDCASIKDGKVVDVLKNTLERDQSDLNFLNPHSSSCSSSCSIMEDSNSSQEAWVMKDEMKNNPEDENVSEQNLFSELPIGTVASASIAADMVENVEIEIADKPLGKSQKQSCMLTTCSLLEKVYDSSSHATETLLPQTFVLLREQECQETSFGLHEESALSSPCSFMEPDSLMSLEEAYHPSPVSVLEPSFTEDTQASSEFSRRVTDNICRLQRHLQLLKSETLDTYSEGPGMIVSSDDETEEESAEDSKEDVDSVKLFRVEESRDFSYLVDVLIEAGFHGRNLKMDFSTLHLQSTDWPISLSVFETLEKKFGDQASWKSSERRLLFDRINAGLMEILHPCMGVPKWAKPVSRRLKPSSDKEMIEEDLWMLLVSQEKEASKYSADKTLGNEIGKLDLGDDIDAIGIEIERLVIGELVAELVE